MHRHGRRADTREFSSLAVVERVELLEKTLQENLGSFLHPSGVSEWDAPHPELGLFSLLWASSGCLLTAQ